MNLIRRLLIVPALVVASLAHAQTYNLFKPATGVLKGNTATYVTTAAVAADITGMWSGTCTASNFLRGDGTCAAPSGTGTVTSVGLTMPSGFSVGGSPVTTTGTLAVTTTLSGVLKGNGSGFTTSAAADITGLWSGTCSSSNFLRGDGACAAPGTGSPGGATTQVQFNNAGSFDGAAGLTWATSTLTATNLAGAGAGITALNASNLSSGTVPDARFPATLPAASGVNLTALNATNLGSGTVPDARFPATLPAASGVNLTALNATNLGSGTVPDARFPATLPAASGVNLTALNATNLGSGTVPSARLSGTYSSALTLSSASNAFTGDGSALTSLNATNVSSGTLNNSRLPGTVNVGTALQVASVDVCLNSGTNCGVLNASNLSSGTVADARLSSNVPLKNAANNFTAAQTITIAGSYASPQLLLNGAQYGTGVDASGNVLFKNTNNGVYNFYNAAGAVEASIGAGSGALTKADDTNVTLTLGGSPTTALLNSASITLGWTGTLAVSRGGSGAGTLSGVLHGNGTSAFTAGNVALASEVSGTLPVGNGGTGTTTSTGTGNVVLSASPTLTGTLTAAAATFTSATVGGSSVCRADGTNCPASSGGTIKRASVTVGASSCTIGVNTGVSSCTYNGAGDYTVTFGSAFSASATCVTTIAPTGNVTLFPLVPNGTVTSTARFQFFNSVSVNADVGGFNIICIGP